MLLLELSQIAVKEKWFYKNDVKSCSLKMELENVVVVKMSTGWTWRFLVEYFAKQGEITWRISDMWKQIRNNETTYSITKSSEQVWPEGIPLDSMHPFV